MGEALSLGRHPPFAPKPSSCQIDLFCKLGGVELIHDAIAAHSAAALDGTVPEATEALLAALQVHYSVGKCVKYQQGDGCWLCCRCSTVWGNV